MLTEHTSTSTLYLRLGAMPRHHYSSVRVRVAPRDAHIPAYPCRTMPLSCVAQQKAPCYLEFESLMHAWLTEYLVSAWARSGVHSGPQHDRYAGLRKMEHARTCYYFQHAQRNSSHQHTWFLSSFRFCRWRIDSCNSLIMFWIVAVSSAVDLTKRRPSISVASLQENMALTMHDIKDSLPDRALCVTQVCFSNSERVFAKLVLAVWSR